MTKDLPKSKRIVMIVYEGAQIIDITGPTELFAMANDIIRLNRNGQPLPYKIELWANQVGKVTMSSGIPLHAEHSFRRNRAAIDTLLVPGGTGITVVRKNRNLIAFLCRAATYSRRIASICTGTFLLAEARLLDGKTVTTHWNSADRLQQEFPQLQVDANALYIKQGTIYTSAGVTAGIDLALALVEEDLGREAANRIAKRLVVFLRRPGGQAQFSSLLQRQTSLPADFSELHAWLLANLTEPITVEMMARQCAISPRHFARRFLQKMQTTPARFLETLRVEQARVMLEQGDVSLKTIAHACGFNSVEQLRRSFVRLLGVTPSDYQSRF